MKPIILLTNDDGVTSPGLLAAAEALADLGELRIVAPATQQTGMGRGAPPVTAGEVTVTRLRVGGQDVDAYAVPGSPAQAVMYGVVAFGERRPALTVAGINYGENIGSIITASGTVGAALESAANGVPALAVSLETPQAYHYLHGADTEWPVSAHFTRYFAQQMLSAQLPADVDVLKIDIPDTATIDTPWRVTCQSRQSYYESYLERDRALGVTAALLPQLGQVGYRRWVNWDTVEPDSDIQAFAGDRVISVTPISLDMTSRTNFTALDRLLRRNGG